MTVKTRKSNFEILQENTYKSGTDETEASRTKGNDFQSWTNWEEKY